MATRNRPVTRGVTISPSKASAGTNRKKASARKADAGSEAAERSGTPDYLVPKMGQYPVADTAYYQSVTITSMDAPAAAKETRELDGPLDLTLGTQTLHATAPAQGVILVHEQAWYMKGLALGNLLHSLCLAPGEVTKVAMIDWHRQTRASTSESVEQSETLRQSGFQNRAISEVQNAVAHETQFGRSQVASRSSSSQGGIGGVLGFLGGSASTASNSTRASAVNFSTGTRNVSASSNQRIHQRTEELAQASRSRRATIVQEVSESESEQLTTRVVANYNHMHALTMQYYEVLEVYEFRTRVTEATRCLFLPMKVLDFADAGVIERYREVLAQAAEEADMLDVREALLTDQDDAAIEQAAAARKKADEARSAAAKARATLVEALANQKAAAQKVIAFQKAMQSNPIKAMSMIGQIAEIQAETVAAASAAAAARGDVTTREAIARKAEAEADVLEKAAKISVARLPALLNRDQLYFNQAIWMRLDPFAVSQLVADRTYEGESLAETLDPEPVTVFGNYVGFRWRFPADREKDAEAFAAQFVDIDESKSNSTVSIPTGGVFAEAVPGQSNCAEEIDVSRFWNWQDSPIPILPPSIAPLQSGSRAQATAADAGSLDAPAVQLQGPAAMPDPSGMKTITEALVASNLFRDMSGGDAIAKLAEKALGESAAGSRHAADKANENIKTYVEFLKTLAPLVEAYMTKGMSSTLKGGLMNASKKAEGK